MQHSSFHFFAVQMEFFGVGQFSDVIQNGPQVPTNLLPCQWKFHFSVRTQHWL